MLQRGRLRVSYGSAISLSFMDSNLSLLSSTCNIFLFPHLISVSFILEELRQYHFTQPINQVGFSIPTLPPYHNRIESTTQDTEPLTTKRLDIWPLLPLLYPLLY